MTREERLLAAFSEIDPELIAQAGEKPPVGFPWRRLAAMAACLALVVGLFTLGGRGGGTPGGDGEDYDVYMGPVMPLTVMGSDEGLTATRSVTYDFMSYAETNPAFPRIHADVTDAYTLTNTTDEDMTVTLAYPFMGKLSDYDLIIPQITAGRGGTEETRLLIGGALYGDDYVGSGVELIDRLADGTYFAALHKAYPALTQPAAVYHVSSLTYDGPVGEHPTLAMTFTMDPANSRVFVTGGSALRYDDVSGELQLRMDTMDFIYGDDIYVVVLGEDATGYTMQGYSNVKCEDGTEVDGFEVTVERREMSLGDFMADCIDWQAWSTMYSDGLKTAISAGLTEEELTGLTARMLEQCGALDAMGFANSLSLEDYISRMLDAPRMLYLIFDVTVPGRETVSVRANSVKYSSHFYGSGEGDVHGYELMMQLGSNMAFTRQTASVKNTECVEIITDNFGFGEADTVTLDPAVQHYWMKIKSR